MLRTIMVKILLEDLVFINKDNTIDRLGGNSKINKVKFRANF